MILYCAAYSMGILLRCVVHRMRYHSDDYAVIVLPEYHKKIYPDFDFKLLGFDEIYYLRYLEELGQREEVILENFEAVWNKAIGHEIDTFDEIIMCAYWHPVMCYLANRDIPFTLLEEATGAFRRPFLHQTEVEKSVGKDVYEWGMKYGLLDYRGESVINKIFANNPAGNEIQDSRLIHFYLPDELKKLDAYKLDIIKKFFSLQEFLDIDKKSNKYVLLLMTPYGNRDMISMEDDIEFVKCWLAYFAEGKHIIFKLHPGDLVNYNEFLPEANLIDESLPGELLILYGLDEALLIGFNSALEEDLSNPKRLDFTFPEWKVEEYPLLHRFYALKMLYKEISTREDIRIFALTKRGCLLRNFEIPYLDDLSALDEKGSKLIYLDADDIEERDLERILCCKGVLVMFGELCNGYLASVHERKKQLIMKTLRILHKDGTEENHPMYFFTNDEELSRIVCEWNYRKELQYLEDVVEVEGTWEEGRDSSIPIEITSKYCEYLEHENAVMRRTLQNVRKTG